jgi:predicted RNA polymerase sigma factor
VATYYHLGKLLERKGQKEEAKQRYTQGIEIAKKANDRHSLSELQSAFLELEYD